MHCRPYFVYVTLFNFYLVALVKTFVKHFVNCHYGFHTNHVIVFNVAEAIRTMVVPIRILIRTTVVPKRILIRTTVVRIRILIGTTRIEDFLLSLIMLYFAF